MLVMALLVSSNLLLCLGALTYHKGLIAKRDLLGVAALATVPSIVAFCLDGITYMASAFAALGAVNAWIWWHGGGGDDTKRRLKSWARRFQGVRRTAPSRA